MKNLLLAASLLATLSGYSQQYALSLNGTTGYIEVADHNAIDLNATFTIETWVYPTGNGSHVTEGGMIFNKEGSYELSRFADGTLRFALSANGTGSDWSWTNTALVVPLNRWSHISMVKNGTSVAIYLNAATSFTSTAPATLTANTHTLRIGNRTNSAHFFQGHIDNFRVWNTARPLSSIKETVFGLTNGPASTGLVIDYPFLTNSGSTANNYATNFTGLDGTVNGGTSWTGSAIHRAANALAFDGGDDFVSTSISMNNLAAFTMEGWVNFRNTGGVQSLFGQNDLLEFGIYNGALVIWVAAGVNNLTWAFTPTDIPVNTWHHIAAVGNGTHVLIYVDGIERARAALTTGNYGSSPYLFNIGGAVWTPGGLGLDGRVDEVRLWNTARTQAQIQANMNSEIDPVTATGLVSYYQFNGGIPAGNNTGLLVAIDSRGNNNGTLNNMDLTGGTLSNLTSNNPIIALPVTWAGFTAKALQSDILLNWSTAQESSTRDFVVQYTRQPSAALGWVSLYTIAAAGNSNTHQHYNYTHKQPGSGVHYYRILQRDLDGKETYSTIQSIRLNEGKSSFRVLGNPARQSIQLQVNEAGVVILANSSGHIIHQQRVQPGTVTLTTASLIPGTYIVRLGEKAEKVIVQ
jgi:hypothetical protein